MIDVDLPPVRRGSRADIGLGLGIACLALFLYLGTLSRHYSADGLAYALDIGRNMPLRLDVYHAALAPLGALWYRLWTLCGWRENAMIPLQVLNACAGAISVGVVFGLALHLSRSRIMAALIAVGFAVSGATWLLSVEAEFVTVPLAAALALLWGALVLPPRDRTAVALALGTGVAALFYLNSLILGAVILVGFLVAPAANLRARTRWAIVYGLALATGLALCGAALILAVPSGSRDPALLSTTTGYAAFEPVDLLRGVYGLLRAVALFPGLALNDCTPAFWQAAGMLERLAFVACYGAVAGILALAAVRLARYYTRRRPPRRRALWMLLVWLIAYAAFAVLWVPSDVSFWAPVIAGGWLLGALWWGDCAQAGVARLRRARWLRVILAGVLLLGAANADFAILPRHRQDTNLRYRLAESLSHHTTSHDLIVLVDDPVTALHIMVFAGRPVFTMAAGTEMSTAVRQELRLALQAVWEARHDAFLVLPASQDWESLWNAKADPQFSLIVRVPAWSIDGWSIDRLVESGEDF
ncbi:MAG: hypothetical protein JXB35_06565 [Anaerolineae bacterium]|nr:hypothetical protein [Anaerolineae bacterium]